MPPLRHRGVRTRDSLSQKMWLIPAAFMLAAAALAELMLWFDDYAPEADFVVLFRGPVTGGQGILTIIATSMLALMGVVFSISIVALQLASTQFSPRVLRTFLRDRSNQCVLGQFAATFVYSIVVLGSFQVDEDGDAIYTSLSVSVGFFLVLGSLGAFIYFIHHISRSLRVVHIMNAVARETRDAIDYNYPTGPAETVAVSEVLTDDPVAVLAFDHPSGVLAAADLVELAALAERHDCVLRLLPEIGVYVSRTAPLCEVHGRSGPTSTAVVSLLEIETERTMYQDVAFGFRQLVDIADRALSPAVNDPTTAVQVVDRLQDFLLELSSRPVPTGVTRDGAGAPRLVHHVVGWSEFVDLAFDEIRDYGAESLPVVRRLHSALGDLVAQVPPDRRPPLVRQQELLARSALAHFGDREELAHVLSPDELATDDDRSGPPGASTF